jgi:hypothetical protein
MRKVNRIVASAILATGVAGGTYAFLAGPLMPTAEARLKDHPKLEAAAAALKDAKEYIEHTESDFHGHKVEALHAIHEALHEIALAAGEHDRSASGVPPIPLEHRHQRLWDARERLKESREYLHESRAEFNGHKEAAMKWIDETIHHLDRMLAD